jgi:HK97 family phage portal protein
VPREFFPGLRRKFRGSAPETKSLDGRVSSQRNFYSVPGQPYNPDWNTDKAVREGYQYNPYVFRAVEVIAQNALARRIVLRRDDPRDGPILETDELDAYQRRLLRVLNRKSNKWEVAPIFRHRMVAQYLLSSRGLFIEVIRNRSGSLWGVMLLDPDMVEIVPTYETLPDGSQGPRVINPIGAFRVRTNAAGQGSWEDRPPYDPEATVEEQPSGVLWVRSPHPTLFTRGMSPIEAAALSVDLDRYARLYNRRFMEQDGRPGGILSVKGNITDATAQRLQARFTGGPEVAGRTTVIEAESMSWQDTSGHPRDTQWGDTMDRMRREISIAFGVPESVLGDASGRTFDNADAEYASFWEHTMQPLLRMLDAQLDVLTEGGYDDDLYLQHDTSDVWVLGRHQRTAEDRAITRYEKGVDTVDEVRDVHGKDPLNIPASRTLHLPPGKVIVSDGLHPGDEEAVAALPMMGMPQPADPGVEAQAGAAEGSALGGRIAGNNAASYRELASVERRALPAGGVEEKALDPEGEDEQSRARVLAWR